MIRRREESTSGVTICSSGWDNVTSRPLINVMMACTSGEVFLHSVNTTGKRKDANYGTKCMIDYIVVVGAEMCFKFALTKPKI